MVDNIKYKVIFFKMSKEVWEKFYDSVHFGKEIHRVLKNNLINLNLNIELILLELEQYDMVGCYCDDFKIGYKIEKED